MIASTTFDAINKLGINTSSHIILVNSTGFLHKMNSFTFFVSHFFYRSC